MTSTKIKYVITEYQRTLSAHIVEKDSVCNLCHCKYMLEIMAEWVKDNRLLDLSGDKKEKAFRWLGFIQGVLFCEGVYTIDEMKDHNRE